MEARDGDSGESIKPRALNPLKPKRLEDYSGIISADA